MSDVALEYDNPFWRFSTKLYRLETVEMACIYLQDHQGVMVNHLLYSCWLATQNVCYQQDWAQQVEPIIGWHNQFVVPLRKQRRHLKAMAKAEPRLKEMREHLLEAEMIAEQHEQALLYLMYALKKGVQSCADRETALRNNMAFVLKDAQMTDTARAEVANLLAMVVDESIAQRIASDFK